MQHTTKEFFEEEMKMGIHADNPQYVTLMKAVADAVKGELKAGTAFEIGHGVGVLINELVKQGIDASGCDPSPEHHEYAIKQFGHQPRYISESAETITSDTDCLISIEVFEHIPDEQLEAILTNHKAKWFVFSSTPHRANNDVEWGHINIKTESEWLALLDKHGWKLNRKITIPTAWALLLERK